jgi:hypothetical protein
MTSLRSPFVRWTAGTVVFMAALAVLHRHPWQRAAEAPAARDGGGPETLTVGYLPVT